jgi:hypothetical protein
MNAGKWLWLAFVLSLSGSAWGQATAQTSAAATPSVATSTSAAASSLAAGSGTEQPSAGTDPIATIPYDSGEQVQTEPSPAGPRQNFLWFGTDFTTSYDDNIWGTGSKRIADVGYLIAPEIALSRKGTQFGLTLDYRPSLLYYQHQSNYNQQNQNLDFDADYRVGERVTFRLRTGFAHYSGSLEPLPESSVVAGIVGPGQLNQTILTPYNEQNADNSRLDISYRIDARSSIGVFGTYAVHEYSQPPGQLGRSLNSEGETGGVQYVRLLSLRTSVGVVYAYEDLHVGPSLRIGLHTPTATFSTQVSRRMRFDAFGGPVYTQMRDTVLIPYAPQVNLAFPVSRDDWHWAAGGDVTFQWSGTALQLDASQQVLDGGGLFTAVTNTTVGASVDRQIARRWRLGWSAGWQRNVALPTDALSGSYEGAYGRAEIVHTLSENVTAAIGYSYQEQRGSGLVPLGSTFDRNFAYITLSYRFRGAPVGR